MVEDGFLRDLTPQSTLAELPAWDAMLPVSALGREIDQVLRDEPALPGVIVLDSRTVRGAISRTQFQNMISRPFGREVVLPRRLSVLLEEFVATDVTVLDRGLPVQEALRVSLERDRTALYEPILVSADGGKSARLVGFTDLLRADSRISSLRNHQMAEILATAEEGFLLVDRGHRIASEYSRSVETILHRTGLAGRQLEELLGESLGPEFAALAYSYVETLFNPNVIEKLVGDINPLKSVRVAEGAGRPSQHLGFSFKRSLEGKEIRRILVRVEDRTREVELAAELEQQERQAGRRVDLAMEMMQVDPDSLTDYLTRFLAEIAQIGRLRSHDPDMATRATVDSIFRLLHGLKGEAGVIGLRSFAQRLHQTEDAVVSLRDSRGKEPAALESLDKWLDELRSLGAEARDLIARLSALALRKMNVSPESRPLDMISALEKFVSELSTRLGKPARFVARCEQKDLPGAYSSVIREALIQFARNSMVHGVETEKERRILGKAVPAILQFALRRHEAEGQLEAVFQDDGRGLDLDRIRERARDLFSIDQLDDGQAAQVIFEAGFSTAQAATGDAGRGVGLDLVRSKIESLGGTILAHSKLGVYCAFQIVLPLEPGGGA
jgi:HPt (histidine-containing phosphotransfer) domain-containing protein